MAWFAVVVGAPNANVFVPDAVLAVVYAAAESHVAVAVFVPLAGDGAAE